MFHPLITVIFFSPLLTLFSLPNVREHGKRVANQQHLLFPAHTFPTNMHEFFFLTFFNAVIKCHPEKPSLTTLFTVAPTLITFHYFFPNPQISLATLTTWYYINDCLFIYCPFSPIEYNSYGNGKRVCYVQCYNSVTWKSV